MLTEGDDALVSPTTRRSSLFMVPRGATIAGSSLRKSVKIDDTSPLQDGAQSGTKGSEGQAEDTKPTPDFSATFQGREALEEDFGKTIELSSDAALQLDAQDDEKPQLSELSPPPPPPPPATESLSSNKGIVASGEPSKISETAENTNHAESVWPNRTSEDAEESRQSDGAEKLSLVKISGLARNVMYQPKEHATMSVDTVSSASPSASKTPSASVRASAATDPGSNVSVSRCADVAVQVGDDVVPMQTPAPRPAPPSFGLHFELPHVLHCDWILVSHSSLFSSTGGHPAYCRFLLLDSPIGVATDQLVANAARAMGVDTRLDLVLLASQVRRVRVLRDAYSKQVMCEVSLEPKECDAAAFLQSFIESGEQLPSDGGDSGKIGGLACVSDARDLSQLLGEPLMLIASSDKTLEAFLRSIVPFLQ